MGVFFCFFFFWGLFGVCFSLFLSQPPKSQPFTTYSRSVSSPFFFGSPTASPVLSPMTFFSFFLLIRNRSAAVHVKPRKVTRPPDSLLIPSLCGSPLRLRFFNCATQLRERGSQNVAGPQSQALRPSVWGFPSVSCSVSFSF